jgi:hypothetical protein
VERVRYQTFIADSARWDGFVFRADDIVISTPPKCGTTWLQMICALEIFQTTTFDRPLDQISPWVDILARPVDDVRAQLQAQTHRRFIKTHTPLDGLPFDERVTYLCVTRDPRDVAVSWDSHINNANPETFFALREAAVGNDGLDELLAAGPPMVGETERERFWSWVDSPSGAGAIGYGLESMLHHLDTFWAVRDRPNIVLVRYEDLLDDLDGQMRLIADRLGIRILEPRWFDLVAAATFDSMKTRAGELAPEASHRDFYNDQDQFFHKGATGQWHHILASDDIEKYAARVAECAPPDLAAWIHRPPLPPRRS